MLSVEQCREIIGCDAENMSDKEIEKLRDNLYVFCESTIDYYFESKLRKNHD